MKVIFSRVFLLIIVATLVASTTSSATTVYASNDKSSSGSDSSSTGSNSKGSDASGGSSTGSSSGSGSSGSSSSGSSGSQSSGTSGGASNPSGPPPSPPGQPSNPSSNPMYAQVLMIIVSHIPNIALSKSIPPFHHKKPSGSAHVSNSNRHTSAPLSNTNSPTSINPSLVSKISNKTDKIVMLTFGDTKKSQFTIAKPILDQYGFKASFFITCNYANDGDRNPRYHMSWNNILALQNDGQASRRFEF